MSNRLSRLTIGLGKAWPTGIPYRGRYPNGPTQIAAAATAAAAASGSLAGGTPATGVMSFSWVPATTNTDTSSITTGEVTGFQVGIRSSGSPGTYPIILEVDGPFTSDDLANNIQPPLTSGTYFAAVRSTGPTPSAWSPENTFTIP